MRLAPYRQSSPLGRHSQSAAWASNHLPPVHSHAAERTFRIHRRGRTVSDSSGQRDLRRDWLVIAWRKCPLGCCSVRHHEREHTMAKYMIKASYSPEGIKGVMAKGGTARAEAIEKVASGVGGTVDGVYFSFRSDDLFAIVDAPNHEAMAAIAGTVGQTGALRS